MSNLCLYNNMKNNVYPFYYMHIKGDLMVGLLVTNYHHFTLKLKHLDIAEINLFNRLALVCPCCGAAT